MAKNFTRTSFVSIPNDDSSLSVRTLSEKKKVSLEEVPHEAVIQNILNFSKTLKVGLSERIGMIEFVLN